MVPDTPDDDRIAREGRLEIVAAADDAPHAYLLRSDDGDEFPIRTADADDLYALVDRLHDRYADAEERPEAIEITCHACGKTWQHAGGDPQATCPNCGTLTPVEGAGP
ncbi:hypothetical protein ACNS7O_09710 [Haloferacaceae archaeon DSL9]